VKQACYRRVCAGLVLSAALFVASHAQTPPLVKSKAGTISLAGVWNISGGGGGGGGSFSGRPESEWSTETLPFTAAGLAAFNENKPGKGPRMRPPALGNDPLGGANPPGLYRTLIYSRPFEIVQVQGKLLQVFEWGRVWRAIYTDGRTVPDDIPQGPFWYGYSVGKWEGETLVVTTLALDGRAWLDEWGTPFSDEARIEERWQRVAPDKLQMKMTVRDPAYYSKPWTSATVTYSLQRDVEPMEIIFSPIDENAFNEAIRNPAGLPAKQP
jgi:hypothetical protein